MAHWLLPLVALSAHIDHPGTAEIRALIEGLGSEDVGERERSSLALRRLGASALSPLERAMKDRDPEVAGRASDAHSAICDELAIESIKLDDVDLNSLSLCVQRVTHKTILWTEDLGLVRRRARIVSDVPLKKHPDLLFRVYQSILQVSDLALVPLVIEGGEAIYKVKPSANDGMGRRAAITESGVNEDRFVTRVFQLKNVRPREVQVALNVAIYPQSIIVVDSEGVLITTDFEDNIKRFQEIVKSMDRHR